MAANRYRLGCQGAGVASKWRCFAGDFGSSLDNFGSLTHDGRASHGGEHGLRAWNLAEKITERMGRWKANEVWWTKSVRTCWDVVGGMAPCIVLCGILCWRFRRCNEVLCFWRVTDSPRKLQIWQDVPDSRHFPCLASFSVGLPVVVWLCWAQLDSARGRSWHRELTGTSGVAPKHIPVLNLLCGFMWVSCRLLCVINTRRPLTFGLAWGACAVGWQLQ
jgi:hypothetical protein